eukprot:sb/3474286/
MWTDACQNDIDYVVQLANDAVEGPYLLQQLNLNNHTELYKSKANSSCAIANSKSANSKSASETDIKMLLVAMPIAWQSTQLRWWICHRAVVQSDLYLTAPYLAAPLFNGRIFSPKKFLTKISEKFQNLCFLSLGFGNVI